jgi:hypothetical protein
VATKPSRLTTAQRTMLETLRDCAPLSSTAMLVNFGIRWQETWDKLYRLGLVRYTGVGKHTADEETDP